MTEPFKTTKVLGMDAIIIISAQEATLKIFVIAEIAAVSQLLMIIEAKIIILNLKSNQGPILVASQNSDHDHSHHIHDDNEWNWGQDHNLSHNSSPKKEHSMFPP